MPKQTTKFSTYHIIIIISHPLVQMVSKPLTLLIARAGVGASSLYTYAPTHLVRVSTPTKSIPQLEGIFGESSAN